MKILKWIKSDYSITSLIVLGLCFLLSSVVVFLWNDLSFDSSLKVNSEKFGHFGDVIGGLVGSLWALAGIFLFYKALTEQREDFKTSKKALDLQVDALNQQIEEFKLSRDEQISSRKVYEKQSDTLKTQQFESNFYSLLDVYRSIKNKIDFQSISIDMSRYIEEGVEGVEKHIKLVKGFGDIYQNRREELSHYFRIVYRMMKTIDSNHKIDTKEKQFYMKLFRAQFSDFEIMSLYYNSHTFYGEKTRKFILNYNLFKHMPIFCKTEFSKYLDFQGDSRVIVFSERLELFLIKHLPEFYKFDSDIEKIEEKFIGFDVFVGVYFKDTIEIKILCSSDIQENKIKLSDDLFSEFICDFLYEKLIFNRYLNTKEFILEKSLITRESSKEFCFELKTDLTLAMNVDGKNNG